MCSTIHPGNPAAMAKNHTWPERENTPAAEERLSTRYLRVELLDLSPQLHKNPSQQEMKSNRY